MPVDPAQREHAVAALLDAWPWGLGAVIIGGYVNAAYGKPRYSNDLDFVVPVASLSSHLQWLHRQAPPFVDERMPRDLDQNYTGKAARLRQGSITVDLMPGGVMDREAGVHIPEAWITRSPVKQRLVLLDSSTRGEVRLCRPEAFWALKLQAGRRQDLSDLLGMLEQPVDLAEVRQLFSLLWTAPLARKLASVRASLDDPKVYRDAASARGAGSPSSPMNQRAWGRFKAMVDEAIPSPR